LEIPMERIANKSEFRKIDRLSCQIICNNLLVDPLRCSSCSVHFCSTCIKRWIQKTNTCPNCRNKIENLEKAERHLIDDLEDVKIHCILKEKGCEAQLSLKHLEKHEKELCDYLDSKCKFCDFKGITKDVNQHLSNCDLRIDICQNCLFEMNQKQKVAHDPLTCMTNKAKYYEERYLKLMEERNNSRIVRFSKKVKHNNILIDDSRKIARQFKEIKLACVSVLKPKLKGLKQAMLQIKITNLQEWIGLGIGMANELSNIGFSLTDRQIELGDHFGYFISSNAVTWSLNKKDQFTRGIEFETNDIIQINIEFETKKNKIY